MLVADDSLKTRGHRRTASP